jgi:heme-degrading monooxygenase HmoA
MFVRVGTFEVKPGSLPDLLERYDAVCAPLVRSAPGSVDCFVAQPADDTSPVAVCTVWQSEADAQAYESSGTAAHVVSQVREFFAGPPQLLSYRVRE